MRVLVLAFAIIAVAAAESEPEPVGNCKSGWKKFDNEGSAKCYKVFTQNDENVRPMDFDDALQFCQGQDGRLVTIHNQDEQDFLTALVGESGVHGSILIGLKRPNRWARHEWVDGTSLNNFENWVRGEPSNSNGNEGCAQMQTYESTAGQWNDIPCDTEKFFVCEQETDPSLPPSESDSVSVECPEGFTKYRESCYSVSNESKTRAEAEEECQAKSSNLVSIQDNFEIAFLKTLVEEGLNYWIGLQANLKDLNLFEDKKRHQLSWSDNRPVTNLDWDEDEPHYSSNQETQCVQLKSNTRWSIADCEEKKPFICIKHNKIYEKQEPVEGVCPNGGDFRAHMIDVGKENCYVLNTGSSPRDWEIARHSCKVRGGDLATFETRDDLNLLRPYLNDARHQMYWVGIRSINNRGDFKTIKGQSIPEDLWHDGEPNLLDLERCAAVYSQSMQLYNFRCFHSHNFICEIPKIAPKEVSTEISSTTCEDNEFRCNRGNECIPRRYVCDGDFDCADRSDETLVLCANKTCGIDEFKCTNGKCISERFVCDGDNDCGDNSDESIDICNENRICPDEKFLCGIGGMCISRGNLCDGYDDCGNGKDEENCPPKVCDSDEFTCENKKCVSATFKCDGDDDCKDNSDEKDCEEITCPIGKWLCGNNKKCVGESYVCDGDNDCGDNSDEQNCDNVCKPFEFKCENNKCVKSRFLCDGDNDCGDNSDEQNCDKSGSGSEDITTAAPDIIDLLSGSPTTEESIINEIINIDGNIDSDKDSFEVNNENNDLKSNIANSLFD